jgi:hypothetical protein
VTDRDLRNRAVAEGLDMSRPVIDIATVAPLTMDISQPGFEALLLMARHNIHHVPVMDGDAVVGMITATDVTEQHSTSAVYLAGDIHKQTTLDGLVACAAKVRALQRTWPPRVPAPTATGHIITAITDALTTRLLHLGEAKFGPPPVDYAWVAAGSQARSEQTAKSDQDNCMMLDDRYDEAEHGAYFKALSSFVCDGLDACGYIHCPGEMMAMTDKWRQPRRVWAEYFRKWVDTPEPMALMLTCVFFDVRTVAGRADLLDGLRRDVLQRTRDNKLFLAHMVGNALTHQPPLGLFGGLSTIRSGEHKGTIDLKHTGIVPVIDLARVYALAGGHDAVNTHDRLAHAADSGEISEQSVHDLRDALEFLAALRIRHQAGQIAAGEAADNYLRPDDLSNFERGQLKDAFGVVKQLQEVLAQRYQGADSAPAGRPAHQRQQVRRWRGCRIEGVRAPPAQMGQDLAHVQPGLGVRRHAAVALDGAFAGVVGRRREHDVALEAGQQPAQVGHAAADVLRRVQRIAHAEAARGVGNQLHQAHRILGRHGRGIEVGLGGDHRQHQRRRQLEIGSDQIDEAHDGCRRPLGRRWPGQLHGRAPRAAGRWRRRGRRFVHVRRPQAGWRHTSRRAHRPQHVLRLRHALLSRGGKQVRRLRVVAQDAAAIGQHPGQIELRFGIAIAGGAAVQLGGARGVALDAVAMLQRQGLAPPGLHLDVKHRAALGRWHRVARQFVQGQGLRRTPQRQDGQQPQQYIFAHALHLRPGGLSRAS